MAIDLIKETFASKELGFYQTEGICFLGFHRHYFRDNTTGDDVDEYSWLASLSTADILTPVEPATYSLAWAIALMQAKMAVFPTAARRYSLFRHFASSLARFCLQTA